MYECDIRRKTEEETGSQTEDVRIETRMWGVNVTLLSRAEYTKL